MGLPEHSIPEDKLPQCWSDDVRMNALFAPFRLKTANPESWDMKMKFWSDMIRVWCRCRGDPVVAAADAKFAFQRKGRTPACIELVVEEMFRSGELSPITKYQQILHNGPESWVRWGARLAFKPAAFALTAVTSLLPARQATDSDGLPKASIDSTQRFVVEAVVKEQATQFLETYPSNQERIGTIEDLMLNSGWKGSREVFEILLGYLVSQGAAAKKDDVIKLAEASKKVSAVTETDSAVVKLVSTERRLEAELERMEKDVRSAEADARAALQIGSRIAAKNHLRRKHAAQKRLEVSEATLEKVRQMLVQMRNTDVNAAVVDTFRTTKDAMKRNMKDGDLDEDKVHDTLDELKEVMTTYNEIEKALGGTTDDVDMAELEEELKELLSGPGVPPSGGTPRKEQAPDLPSPPKEKPANRLSEREFVFDGEERVIAELNELGIEDASPRDRRLKVPVAVPAQEWTPVNTPKKGEPQPPKLSKSWYPPTGECLKESAWNNNDTYGELRQDDRLHPGQPVNVDFTTPPRLYSNDFQVRDHKMSSGVWIYNRDDNSNIDTDLTASTEYFSAESPGKIGGSFQMAPGGERKKSTTTIKNANDETLEDLERRLRDLRGFL